MNTLNNIKWLNIMAILISLIASAGVYYIIHSRYEPFYPESYNKIKDKIEKANTPEALKNLSIKLLDLEKTSDKTIQKVFNGLVLLILASVLWPFLTLVVVFWNETKAGSK